MPVITLESTPLSHSQKEQLVAVLTEDVATIMAIPKEAIFVFLHENERSNIGVSGKLLPEKKPNE